MRIIFNLLILICLFNFYSFSQVENIKQNSKPLKVGEGQEFHGGHGFVPLFYFLFRDIAIGSIDLLINHQRFLLDNKDNYPDAFSFEYMPAISLNQENQFNMMQRVRGTYGVLSTDLRLNYLAEFSHNSAQSYSTIDWQILQLSIYPSPDFNIRFGTGLLHDNYSGMTYNEQSLGLEFYLAQHKYWFTIEGRFAYDYSTVEDVYDEFNLKGSYLFFQTPHLRTYVSAGILYQYYYSATEISTAQFGLIFKLH